MLTGKVALVTGAASGIGKDTALRLLENGAIVVSCDIDVKGLCRLKRESGYNKDNIILVEMDISDIASHANIVDVITKLDQLDILVNSAGICSGTTIEDIDEFEWNKTFDVNIKGLFFLTRMLISYMGKGGTIINVSSMAGFTGGIKCNPAYSCSKAAVTCMTKNFAKYCAERGVRVNEVSPGTTITPMTLDWLGEESLEEFKRYVPLKKLTQASDIGKAIMFFASEESALITGQSLQVNGGMYIP